MKRTVAWMVCLAMAGAFHASAALVASEAFDYSTGSINGQNGGSGFTAGWVSTTGEQVASGSLPQIGLPVSGNKLEVSNATVTRSASWANIGYNKDATHYYSMLVNHGATTNNSSEVLTVEILNSGGGLLWGFQFLSDEKVRLYHRYNTGGTSSAGALDPNANYLFLMKTVTSSSVDDEFYLTWFEEGEAIPDEGSISWDLTLTHDSGYGGVGAGIKYAAQSLITAQMDEFMVGTTLPDVIPEPTTISLVMITGFGLVLIRRKMMI